MTADEIHDFATRYTAAWCSIDADAVASFFAEDGSIAVNGGEPAVGRTAIVELVQGFYEGVSRYGRDHGQRAGCG